MVTKIKPAPFVVSVSVACRSGQAKALIVIDGLCKPHAQGLLAAVLGQVEEVIAGVSYGQVLVPARRGLDDDA